MIIEKKCFDLSNQNETPIKAWRDENGDLSVELFKNMLTNAFARGGLRVTITEDLFKYKTGFLKSAKAPCLVIRNADDGKEFYEYVLAVIPNAEKQCTLVDGAWNGEAEADRLNAKIEKLCKKMGKSQDHADKLDRRASRSDSSLESMVGATAVGIGSDIANKVRGKKVNKLAAQLSDERQRLDMYTRAVASVVNSVLDTVSETHQVMNINVATQKKHHAKKVA